MGWMRRETNGETESLGLFRSSTRDGQVLVKPKYSVKLFNIHLGIGLGRRFRPTTALPSKEQGKDCLKGAARFVRREAGTGFGSWRVWGAMT